MSDNTTVVAYLWHQGRTVSRVLCSMVAEVALWTECHSISLTSRCIPGKNFIWQLGLVVRDQILPTVWSLFSRVFEAICRVFGRPHLYFFATHANAKLPLHVSPVPDLMAWKQDVVQHP